MGFGSNPFLKKWVKTPSFTKTIVPFLQQLKTVVVNFFNGVGLKISFKKTITNYPEYKPTVNCDKTFNNQIFCNYSYNMVEIESSCGHFEKIFAVVEGTLCRNELAVHFEIKVWSVSFLVSECFTVWLKKKKAPCSCKRVTCIQTCIPDLPLLSWFSTMKPA